MGKLSPAVAEQVSAAPAEAVGEAHVAVAPAELPHSVMRLGGQVTVAAGGAVTVMLKEPEASLPDLSVAMQETVVVPTGKV